MSKEQDAIINVALEQMEAFDVLMGVYDGNANALLAMAQGTDPVRTVTVTIEQGENSAVVEVVASGPKVFAKWMPKETAWQCAKDLQKAAIAVGFDPHKEMRTLSGPVEPPKNGNDVKAMLNFRASLLETPATDSWTMIMALKRIEELEAAEEAAFRAGWYTNAATVEQTAEYLKGCEDVDWEQYRKSRSTYLGDLQASE